MKRTAILLILLWLTQFITAQRAENYKKYLDLGRTEVLKGNYLAGKALFDTAISVMPYYPAIYQDRGYALMQLKHYENAISDFTIVLLKQPYQAEVRYLRGEAYYYVGKYQEALTDFEQVLTDVPGNSKAMERITQMQKFLVKSTSYQNTDQRKEDEEIRYNAAREREAVIWGTVVPLLFWTAVFTSW